VGKFTIRNKPYTSPTLMHPPPPPPPSLLLLLPPPPTSPIGHIPQSKSNGIEVKSLVLKGELLSITLHPNQTITEGEGREDILGSLLTHLLEEEDGGIG